MSLNQVIMNANRVMDVEPASDIASIRAQINEIRPKLEKIKDPVCRAEVLCLLQQFYDLLEELET